MPTLEKAISAFERLGEYLSENGLNFPDDLKLKEGSGKNDFNRLIEESQIHNPWYIPEFVREACRRLGKSLTNSKLNHWLNPYRNKLSVSGKVRNVGVVMAGNIPLAGFHDFLCVLMSGNRFIGKLSADDNMLLPFIARKLVEFEPGYVSYIEMIEGKLENFNAVIATGSNNSSRYFEYYFEKYPHIIRKNRNGVAILTGHESIEDFKNLGKDIFLYFGLGCRNVSKVFVPAGYSFDSLFQAMESYRFTANHHKFYNNYEYYKSIFLINGVHHLDNGFVLVTKDNSYSSPPAVLYYEEYDNPIDLIQKLKSDSQYIQCIVSGSKDIPFVIPFGTAQNPELWDYADGIDTMEFLISLKSLKP